MAEFGTISHAHQVPLSEHDAEELRRLTGEIVARLEEAASVFRGVLGAKAPAVAKRLMAQCSPNPGARLIVMGPCAGGLAEAIVYDDDAVTCSRGWITC